MNFKLLCTYICAYRILYFTLTFKIKKIYLVIVKYKKTTKNHSKIKERYKGSFPFVNFLFNKNLIVKILLIIFFLLETYSYVLIFVKNFTIIHLVFMKMSL